MACQWSCTDVSFMRTSSFLTTITQHDMSVNATDSAEVSTLQRRVGIVADKVMP